MVGSNFRCNLTRLPFVVAIVLITDMPSAAFMED